MDKCKVLGKYKILVKSTHFLFEFRRVSSLTTSHLVLSYLPWAYKTLTMSIRFQIDPLCFILNSVFTDRKRHVWIGKCSKGFCGAEAACKSMENTFTCLCTHDALPPILDVKCSDRRTGRNKKIYMYFEL